MYLRFRSISISYLVVAAAFVCLPRFALGQGGIPWGSDLRQAQQQAKDERKLILIHFYNDGCPPCERLEQNVFSQGDVAAAVGRNYVPVKIHAGNSPLVAKKFQVDRWPTDLLVTQAGQEVYRTVSPASPVTYIAMLDGVANKAGMGLAREAAALEGQVAAAPAVAANAVSASATQAAAAGEGYIVNRYLQANKTVNRYAEQGQAVAGAAQSQVAASQQAWQGAQADAQQGMANAQQMGQQTVGGLAGQANQAMQQGQQQAGQYMAQTEQYAQQRVQQGSQQVTQQAEQLASRYLPSAAAAPAQQSPSIYANPAAVAGSTPPTQDQAWNPASDPAAANPVDAGRGNPYGPTTLAGNPQGNMSRPYSGAATPDITAPRNGQVAAPSFVPASQAPPFALERHCPVTLMESTKWTKGNVQFGAVHRGRTYLFVSEAAQKKFLADPDRYSPVLSGCDPVVYAESGQLVDGKRTFGVAYRGQMFFFADAATRERFEKSAQAYAAPAYQAMMQGDASSRYR